MLHVDPAWLADPHRVFPVTLDLPLVTMYSLYHTGVLGTVTSCQPALPSPLTDIVVGRLRGCTYHGQVYFNLDVLPLYTPIKRAMLRLYAPARIATTRVMVYSNTASADVVFDPTIAPSWSSAPAYAGPGVAQSSGDGHWQSWDVTRFAQGWSDNSASNAGLTLVSNSKPVSFTSPLGASDESPLYAPYLDIIFNPDPAARG